MVGGLGRLPWCGARGPTRDAMHPLVADGLSERRCSSTRNAARLRDVASEPDYSESCVRPTGDPVKAPGTWLRYVSRQRREQKTMLPDSRSKT